MPDHDLEPSESSQPESAAADEVIDDGAMSDAPPVLSTSARGAAALSTFEAEHTGPDAPSQTLDRAAAHRWEEQFLASFRGGIARVNQLPHLGEGHQYDFEFPREHIREWDDRGEARRHLLRAGGDPAANNMPVNRAVQITLIRKPLFGAAAPRVSVVAATWSPHAALASGRANRELHAAGIDVLDEVLERALVAERPKVWHYIGICSTSGWEAHMHDPLPSGSNYSVALIAPEPPGWTLRAPQDWPPELAAAYEAESLQMKQARVAAFLESAHELSLPGGLLLIEEVAQRAVVPYPLAWEVARAFTEYRRDVVMEEVEGSTIIRKRR